MNDRLLDGAPGGTLVSRVMETVRRRIAVRQLEPGTRLPSIREFARTLGVSNSTVVEAYERLAAEGVIRARPGSGFYVARQSVPLSLAEVGPRLDREVDPLWVSRQSLDADEGTLKPGCGWLPASWMPDGSLRRALRNLARADARPLVAYDAAGGLAGLRQVLARGLVERGIEAAPDQIMLTSSATQAIDLLCRFLLRPGDTVLVDDPCYFNFLALLRAHRVEVAGVPWTPCGPDVERLAQVLTERRPRLYLTNSGVHNPTGATLSPTVAHRVLKLAEAHDLTIIEDDAFADFELEPAPRLAALDGLNRVVHVGSFSKTLSAAVRCGYVAVRRDWLEALTDLRIATSYGGCRISAELVLGALSDGKYRKHVEALRQRLAGARSDAVRNLAQLGIEPWVTPHAGIFLWCRLPAGVDATEVARHALADGVVLAPGNVFSVEQRAGGMMRFNVARCSHPRLMPVVEAALRRASAAASR